MLVSDVPLEARPHVISGFKALRQARAWRRWRAGLEPTTQTSLQGRFVTVVPPSPLFFKESSSVWSSLSSCSVDSELRPTLHSWINHG
ncbi:hypothetical protein PoB_005501100 [Plakobranchus ocellatus]|uniref:Uncharacterized protein n=1 Tax=Plakobranchus ocellatus TaxID=259542 RepID=A0AAV4C725_9GAST|nr:hypothetical protein PoB_005501100 [Plakobranchus ocellatus]